MDRGGDVTVYDTLDHRIGGVSQQQGSDDSLTFSSQYGTLTVASLPVISGTAEQANAASANFAPAAPQETRVEAERSFGDIPAPAASSDDAGVSLSPATSAVTADTAPSRTNESATELLALLEKLAQLHSAGVLTDEEFSTKKTELLARL